MLLHLQSIQGFYSSKTPVHKLKLVRHLDTKLKQINCVLSGFTTNSMHSSQAIVLTTKTCIQRNDVKDHLGSVMVIIALFLWVVFPLNNPSTVCVTYMSIKQVK